jgi:hypothetical protein
MAQTNSHLSRLLYQQEGGHEHSSKKESVLNELKWFVAWTERHEPLSSTTTQSPMNIDRVFYRGDQRVVGTVYDWFVASDNLRGDVSRFKKVPLISWIPPAELVALDTPGTADEEAISLMGQMVRWVSWAATVVVPSAREREQQREREAAQVRSILDKKRALAAKRLAKIEKKPIVVRATGVVVANFTGSHDSWYEAMNPAFEAIIKTYTKQTQVWLAKFGVEFPYYPATYVISMFGREFLEQAAKTEQRAIEKQLFRGYDDPVFDQLRFPSDGKPAALSIVSAFAEARLASSIAHHFEPYYVLRGFPNQDLVREMFSHLMASTRQWFKALRESTDIEADAWINVKSKHRLLQCFDKKHFFFLEDLSARVAHGDGHEATTFHMLYFETTGTDNNNNHGATDADNKTVAVPVFISVRMRDVDAQGYLMGSHDDLLRYVIHEFAHILDSGDPTRHDKHDDFFKRAHQFTINMACRAGILSDPLCQKFGSWTFKPALIDAFTALERAPYVAPEELREQLFGPRGSKRARDYAALPGHAFPCS